MKLEKQESKKFKEREKKEISELKVITLTFGTLILTMSIVCHLVGDRTEYIQERMRNKPEVDKIRASRIMKTKDWPIKNIDEEILDKVKTLN